MKALTKQELKDRIAELEAEGSHALDWWITRAANADKEAKRATLAAYALLATLAVITFWEVIL